MTKTLIIRYSYFLAIQLSTYILSPTKYLDTAHVTYKQNINNIHNDMYLRLVLNITET